ncbi:hypothetical protein Sbs19_14840 [Sphingobium sp. BS19]|nr:hypothetical protein Sbs19_14840 [Sphingobium sp. BS19]
MADTELQAMYPPTAKAIYSIGWAKIAPIFYTDDCPGIADIDLGSNGIIKRVRLVGAADTTGACYRAVQRKLLLELGEPKQKSPMTWFDGDTQIIFMRALTTNTMRSIEGSPMFDTWRITYQRKRRE